jgi:endonuclease YncB( thermonuclease family)
MEGVDANLEQVKAGMAWHYKQYQKEQTPSDRALYSEADRAKAGHIGLWADPNPTPPWEFRHR